MRANRLTDGSILDTLIPEEEGQTSLFFFFFFFNMYVCIYTYIYIPPLFGEAFETSGLVSVRECGFR